MSSSLVHLLLFCQLKRPLRIESAISALVFLCKMQCLLLLRKLAGRQLSAIATTFGGPSKLFLKQFGSLNFILPTKKTIAHRVSYICFGVLMQDAVPFVVAKIGWETTFSHCYHLWRTFTIKTPEVWLTYFCLSN
jgi:hypothetical protein